MKKRMLLLVSLFLFSCYDESLRPLNKSIPPIVEKSATAYIEACTLPPSTRGNKKLTLVLIDESGSNGESEGSDPDGVYRFLNLSKTLPSQNDENSLMGIYYFHNSGLIELPEVEFDESLGDVKPFTSNMEKLKAALDIYEPKNSGSTPIGSSLSQARDEIISFSEKVLSKNSSLSLNDRYSISIVLVSDGVPSDLGKEPDEWKENVKVKLQELHELQNHSKYSQVIKDIVINSAYYGKGNNTFAQGFLEFTSVIYPKEINSFGNRSYHIGKYFSSTEIKWDKLLSAERTRVNTEKDKIFLRNLSLRKDRETGEVFRDSDLDGLHDELETKLGSNPFLADSDHNFINDYIEFKRSTYALPCKGLNTAGRCDEKEAFKTDDTCKTVNEHGELISFDQDKDGFNLCEENFLGTHPLKWDTNGNGLSDRQSFQYDLNPLGNDSGHTPSSEGVDSDGDGIYDLDEIKLGLHPRIAEHPKTQKYEYKETVKYDNTSGVTCFEIEVSNLAFARDGDQIEVVFTESQISSEAKKYMRRVIKPLNKKEVIFKETDFEQ